MLFGLRSCCSGDGWMGWGCYNQPRSKNNCQKKFIGFTAQTITSATDSHHIWESVCILQGCTYNHLHCDRGCSVEGWVPPVFGHHCQGDDPIGNLLIVQRPGHTDHWWTKRRRRLAFCVKRACMWDQQCHSLVYLRDKTKHVKDCDS